MRYTRFSIRKGGSMTESWFKDSHLCTECDALIEVTRKDEFRNIWHCGIECNLLSVEDATIHPNNERKEMETNTVPETYNPNLLVTYKSITDGEVTYPTIKVTSLEYQLDQVKYTEKTLMQNVSLINQITSNLTADGWYNPNIDKEDILRDLCEILGHEPKQTIRITAQISVEAEYEIPLEEVENFDAKYFLQDNLTIDSYNGDLTVDTFDVEDADVDW
jgi:ribosomal protein L37AE/L43A